MFSGRPLWEFHYSLVGIRLEDLVLAPFYLLVILLIARSIKKQNQGTPVEKYVYPALGIKIFSAIVFGLMYQMLWGGKTTMGGDTSVYFQGGLSIWKSLFKNPYYTLQLLFIPEIYNRYDEWAETLSWWYAYFPQRNNPEQLYMYRITFYPVFLALGTYLNTSFIFAFFSFWGAWKVFKIFCEKYPGLEKRLAIAFFFIPSVCFWGSGIMRDTVSLTALLFFFYAVHTAFIKKKRIFKYLTLAILSGWLIFLSKAYVLLTFIPPILIWLYLSNIKQAKNIVLRVVLAVTLLFLFAGVGYVAFVNMANSSEKYALDRLEKRIEGFHSYHTYLSEKGISKSGYHLEIESFTPFGILKAMPAAVNVSLFRPYLWESRSPLILLSAIESTIVLIFALRIILLTGLFAPIKYLKNPEVALGITYAIILGTACGITAYNFGALVRFKIPMLPFFFAALFIMQYYAEKEARAKAQKRAQAASDTPTGDLSIA